MALLFSYYKFYFKDFTLNAGNQVSGQWQHCSALLFRLPFENTVVVQFSFHQWPEISVFDFERYG
jgi:hypothetical protein